MTGEPDTDGRRGFAARWREMRGLGFPRAYPVVQFPNGPLWIAIGAWVVERLVEGQARDYAQAAGTAGIVVWAWLELTGGVNLFRRVLGAAVLVNSVVGLVGRLH